MAKKTQNIDAFDSKSSHNGRPNADKIASNITKPPDYVKDSLKRQYSGKDYTIEDKKNVVRWHQLNKA